MNAIKLAVRYVMLFVLGSVSRQVGTRQAKRFVILADALGLTPVPLSVPSKLHPCNPSIIPSGDGWLVIVRTVKYRLTPYGTYKAPLGDEPQGDNWLLRLTDDLQVSSTRLLTAPSAHGLEDCRLWPCGDQVAVLATAATSVQSYGMGRGTLHEDHLAGFRMLPSPLGQTREKNWMPVVGAEPSRAIYSVFPFRLVDLSDQPSVMLEQEGHAALEGYSGSSQVVAFGDLLLCVVHRRFRIGAAKFYVHRLVGFDESWTARAMSDDMFLERRGVEFCNGLAIKGDSVILSYGVNDGAARLIRLSRRQVETLLRRC